jgi:hypothetical protein
MRAPSVIDADNAKPTGFATRQDPTILTPQTDLEWNKFKDDEATATGAARFGYGVFGRQRGGLAPMRELSETIKVQYCADQYANRAL